MVVCHRMMVVYAGSIYGTQVMVSDRPSWGAGVSWISRTLSQCDKQICVIWKTRAGRFWIFWEVAWRLTSSNHKSWIPPWTASYCTQPEINVANFPRVGAGGKMLGSFKLTGRPANPNNISEELHWRLMHYKVADTISVTNVRTMHTKVFQEQSSNILTCHLCNRLSLGNVGSMIYTSRTRRQYGMLTYIYGMTGTEAQKP